MGNPDPFHKFEGSNDRTQDEQKKEDKADEIINDARKDDVKHTLQHRTLKTNTHVILRKHRAEPNG